MNDRKSQETARVQTQSSSDLPQKLFGRQAVEVPRETLPVLRSAFAVDVGVPVPRKPVKKRLAMYHHRILQLKEKHDLPIQQLGPAEIVREPRFYEGDETDWVLMDWKQDPLNRLYDGELVVPDEIKVEIDRIRATGVDFHELYMGHELPKGHGMEHGGVPLEYLVPPTHPAVQQEVDEYERRIENIRITLSRGAEAGAGAATGLAAIVGAVAGTAVGVASATALGSLMLLDPVLFGVITDESWRVDDQSPQYGLVYVIAAWAWRY